MTIKDIEKQVEATKEARAQLERSLRDSKDQEKEYRAKADEAAVDGDVVSFKKYKALADDAEAMAYVCRKQLDSEQASPVTVAQTQEAWAGYAEAYNKKLTAKLKKVQAAKADYLREYMEAVELQREACRTREQLAGYAEVAKSKVDYLYQMDYIPCNKAMNNRRPLVSLTGTGIQDPDAVALLASLGIDGAELTGDERQRIVFSVVSAHKGC